MGLGWRWWGRDGMGLGRRWLGRVEMVCIWVWDRDDLCVMWSDVHVHYIIHVHELSPQDGFMAFFAAWNFLHSW